MMLNRLYELLERNHSLLRNSSFWIDEHNAFFLCIYALNQTNVPPLPFSKQYRIIKADCYNQ